MNKTSTRTLFLVSVLSLLLLGGCSNWIYRIDIPQGNYLDQRDIDKLRVEMTKEQVEFVLGKPIVKDSFNSDSWYYVYRIKRGMKGFGEDMERKIVLRFEGNKLLKVEGDFAVSEEFNTPLT